MEEVYKNLDEVISCVKDSKEYQTCIELKKQMDSNEEVTDLVEKTKNLQKKYVRSNYDSSVKCELERLEEQLNQIPIYSVYNQNLEKVNEMIEYVKDTLNDYFYQLLNKEY